MSAPTVCGNCTRQISQRKVWPSGTVQWCDNEPGPQAFCEGADGKPHVPADPFEVVGAATHDAATDTLTLLDKRVSLSVFGKPFEGIVNARPDDQTLEVFVPALNNTVVTSPLEVTVIEPTPLPDVDPADALVSIIVKATLGLIAARDEHEKNLRDAVHEIRDLSTTLADLVDRW